MFNNFFSSNPRITPGITHSIGNQTVPNIIPNNCIFAEYIIPKVTKYAEITNGKKEYGSLQIFQNEKAHYGAMEVRSDTEYH